MPQEQSIFEKHSTQRPPVQAPQPTPAPTSSPAPAPFPDEFHEHKESSGLFKKIGILLAVIVVGFFLIKLISGFFGNKNQNVELTYWGLWEDPSIMQSVISDFERANPNIHITYSKEDVKQYRDRLTTRIQNGNGPDIFNFHNSWVPELSSYLLPLPNDTITKDEFKKDFYPVALSDMSNNGGLYGIPSEMDDLVLFINSDMFAAQSLSAPTTWDDFQRDSRLLTVEDSSGNIQTAGAALGAYDNVTHAPDIISLLFLQNGVNLFSFDKSKGQVVDALNFYSSFAQGDQKVWDVSLDPSILAFAKGNLAMYFGYSWDIFTIKAINPNLNFQITKVPHITGGPDMTVASYWATGISSKTQHPKEALLFLNYLASKETEQKLFTLESKSRLFGEPYARTDLSDLLKDNQLVYPFVQQAPDAKSSYFAADTYDDGLNEQADGYLGNAVRSMLGNTSAQTATDTLTQGVLQVLSKYGH